MQMMWFLEDRNRRQKKPPEPTLDIVFATPLYGMDPRLTALYSTLAAYELALTNERKQSLHRV